EIVHAHSLDRIRRIGTMPAIFEMIRSTEARIVEDLPGQDPGVTIFFHIKYNDEYGFPEALSYSKSFPVVGGWWNLEISDFEVAE
ncbi:MAG: hypothetical protein FWE09_08845, partial [Treponema sp.]|nr:hypothetical protein [Treponema sp.]